MKRTLGDVVASAWKRAHKSLASQRRRRAKMLWGGRRGQDTIVAGKIDGVPHATGKRFE
jgi:hypothetical protein